MKTFSEFYEDKEYQNSELNEVATGLFLTQSLLLAFLAGAYAKKGIGKIIDYFKRKRQIKMDAKSARGVSSKIKDSPEVMKAMRDVDKIHKKYEHVLIDVYQAIDKQKADEASNLFNDLPETTQDNPEVRLAIVQQIFQSYKQPPIYINSPGNDTYQAIKKILGQRTARALEVNIQKSLEKYIGEEV